MLTRSSLPGMRHGLRRGSRRPAGHTASRGPAPTAAALALVASLGGCGSSGRRAQDERRMLDVLAGARDAVCACRDLGCAEDAERRLADFLLLHVDSLKKIPAPVRSASAIDRGRPRVDGNDSVANQAARLDGELRACKHRLEEAARSS